MSWEDILRKNTGEYSICKKCGKQFKTLSHNTNSKICNACKKSPLKTGSTATMPKSSSPTSLSLSGRNRTQHIPKKYRDEREKGKTKIIPKRDWSNMSRKKRRKIEEDRKKFNIKTPTRNERMASEYEQYLRNKKRMRKT